MYGAILGDIIGSAFEFDRGGKTKEFSLFSKESTWTDDTVMTVAVAEALMEAGRDATAEEIKKACVKSMQKWGRKYPYAGYGARFIHWVHSEHPKPYKSYGNGSAMRVSAAGWLYDTIERTREVARATAEVSHNHPEGIKGAECTAAVIFMARKGFSKLLIAEYVLMEFRYDFMETVDEMRKRHAHVETCMDSLPKAIRSFIEGESYEDVVRNAVSLGGDTDTLAAIAGAMAEAFYGVPRGLKHECRERIPKDMLAVLKRFRKIAREVVSTDAAGDGPGDGGEADGMTVGNKELIRKYETFIHVEDPEEAAKGKLAFIMELFEQMKKGTTVPTPFLDVNHAFFDGIDPEKIVEGETFQLKKEARLRLDKLEGPDGKHWFPIFLSEEERAKGKTPNVIMHVPIRNIVQCAIDNPSVEGVVVNPFGPAFAIPKGLLMSTLGIMERGEAGSEGG
ncbi:MAG: ADP-ribosylglycohydrolase family protein [Clostridiales bacterium]|nr:ADP-ribosylglycohydrolase family protein [Clostridiales bacterium]